MPRPAVAVVGASGLQGGAVVDALLDQGKFQVVALSRNIGSEAAQALKKKAEVRRADLTDPESLVEVCCRAQSLTQRGRSRPQQSLFILQHPACLDFQDRGSLRILT